MSEYRFPCPNCFQTITTQDEKSGQKMECPTCKQLFIVPPASRGSGPPPLPAASRGELPPPLPRSGPPPIVTPDLGVGFSGPANELERQVLEGGRFVVFQYCFSILILSFKRVSPVIHLPPGEDGAKHAFGYSLLSLLAGWWGIPWGPIWTITTVVNNLRGGKDLTVALLTQQFGPGRAAQIMASRSAPTAQGKSLKLLRWGAATGVLLLIFALMALILVPVTSDKRSNRVAKEPGATEFAAANRQIDIYRGAVAFGNSPKAVAVAGRFSASMKPLRDAMFTGSKSGAFSVSSHQFLTYCELQNTQCAFIVHVPELRKFGDTAKRSLGMLAWMTAQQSLRGEDAIKPGMQLAVGLRGFALYDRVLIGELTPNLAETTNGPSQTITGAHPEKGLLYFFRARTQAEEEQTDLK